MQWSSFTQQEESIGWSYIDNAVTANAFADVIASMDRAFANGTAVAAGVNFAIPLFDNNGYDGSRKVIDISGDGIGDNRDLPPCEDMTWTRTCNTDRYVRNLAASAGITVNAIAMENTDVLDFYTNNVITSDGFAVFANSFATFETSLEGKLVREIGGNPAAVPEPSIIALFGLGLVGFGFSRRRQS